MMEVEGEDGSMRLTNEILSAYIDGELPAEAGAGVALALARDPAARRRFDELRKGDAALREAFDWSRAGEAALVASMAAWLERAEQSQALARRSDVRRRVRHSTRAAAAQPSRGPGGPAG